MATATQINQMRVFNEDLVQRAVNDLGAYFARLDLARPEVARDALLEYLPVLTEEYGDMAAAAAADWYDELREQAGATGAYSARLASTVEEVRVTERTRFAARHLFEGSPGQMLRFLNGALAEWVQEPGWDTIVENVAYDPAAVGWHREARPGACDFCRFLAARGGVYKRETAVFAAHDDCNCVAVASWEPDAEEVPVQVYEASVRTSMMSPERREEHRANIRMYLAEMRDGQQGAA